MSPFGRSFLCAFAILISPCLGFFDMYDYYDSFQEQRYGCQTEGGYCLDMYPPPASAGGAGGEQPEVEMEGGAPTAPPQPAPRAHGARGHHAGGHGAPKTPGKPGATAPPATPAPPRRMVANPMHYIRQNCMNFDFDYFSCGRTGGVCCYQRP